MAEVPPLTSMTTAKIPTKGGRGFEFEFAELGYICSVINPVLAANGLHIYHANKVVDGSEYLVSTIYHTSGESLPASENRLPEGLNANKLYSYGSAMTYFRRYVTLSMLNLWHGEDDAGFAYEPREENVSQATNTTYAKIENVNTDSYLPENEREKWIVELTKIFNEDRTKFDELSNAFKHHFKVEVVSDAIKQQKHIEFILNFLHKKEVAV